MGMPGREGYNEYLCQICRSITHVAFRQLIVAADELLASGLSNEAKASSFSRKIRLFLG